MRVLFYKPNLAWPRVSGHDVHTFYIMKGLGELGADVHLATRIPTADEAVAGLTLGSLQTLGKVDEGRTGLTWAQDRFRGYWGVSPVHVNAFGALADRLGADAVVVSGLDVLPLVGSVRSAARIWYAADEWCWHHCSQI